MAGDTKPIRLSCPFQVGNAAESRTLSASSSNSSSKTEISVAAAAAAHLSCPDLENMVAKAAAVPPGHSDPVPNRALQQTPPSRQSSAPQSLSLTDSSQTESEDMSPLMSRDDPFICRVDWSHNNICPDLLYLIMYFTSKSCSKLNTKANELD